MASCYRLLGLLAVGMTLTGCVSTAPKSFSRTMEPSWSAVEVREGLEYDEAWRTAFNLLSRNFDIDTAMKDEGYLQTRWLLSWTGRYDPAYSVRVTLKFSDDRRTLNIKTEALFGLGARSQLGTDSRLASTIKTDLMGTIGRTTR